MSTLLKELSQGELQANLKMSDGSDAGNTDVTSKTADVKFSLMRNMINSHGDVTGSDVNNFLERSQELNDEVDSVGYAIETDGGEMIKVYVNASQANEFEEELSKMLGLDNDTESAINTLAQKFDIIDVVWPSDSDLMAADPDSNLSIDDSSSSLLGMDQPEVEPTTTDQGIENPDSSLLGGNIPEFGDLAAIESDVEEIPDESDGDESDDVVELDANDKPKKKKKSLMKDIGGKDLEVDDVEEIDDLNDTDVIDDVEEIDDAELDADGNPELDADGNPVIKKKKAKAKVKAEEGLALLGKLAEDARAELESYVAGVAKQGNKGKYYIQGIVTGGTRGRLQYDVKKSGSVQYFADENAAKLEADRLSKERNVAGAKAHFSYTPKLVEDTMSKDIKNLADWKKQSASSPIGASFLSRIMEADDIEPKVTIKDTTLKGLHSRLKKPYEKKIIELFSAMGIPGRIIAKEEGLEDGVRAGAVLIRSGRKATLFNQFYDGVIAGVPAKLIAPTEEPLEEKKRGGSKQKVLETILIHLGLPASLTTISGGGSLSSVMSRTANKIAKNQELSSTMMLLAKAMGITTAEVNEELNEVVSMNGDDYMTAVATLCSILGIPDQNLEYQQPALIKSLRTAKQSLSGRGMVISKMAALGAFITQNTRAPAPATATPAANEGVMVTEAFGALEALTDFDLRNMNMLEPANGPAMLANYEGSGAHEETILAIGIDPEAEDDNKSLRVGIDGPWDGTMHNKYFPNTKDGYKAAVDYANMLRTANLKSGGRPRGWKN